MEKNNLAPDQLLLTRQGIVSKRQHITRQGMCRLTVTKAFNAPADSITIDVFTGIHITKPAQIANINITFADGTQWNGTFDTLKSIITGKKADADESIMRVLNVDSNTIDVDVRLWIEDNAEMTYSDRILKEHIYNIDSTVEEIDAHERKCPRIIKTEVKRLAKLVSDNDCGYLRITFK